MRSNVENKLYEYKFYNLIKLFPDEMHSLIHRFRCEVILYSRIKWHFPPQKKKKGKERERETTQQGQE